MSSVQSVNINSKIDVAFEGTVGSKSLLRTWCMQPFPCTYDQLQRIQRTRHRPTECRVLSLPLDKQYTGQVQVAVGLDLSSVIGQVLIFCLTVDTLYTI